MGIRGILNGLSGVETFKENLAIRLVKVSMKNYSQNY